MLCALFVVKRGHWPEQPLLDQFIASDLGEEMDTETEISGDIRNLLLREVSVNAYGFHFGRNESEQNEDDGATRSETREIQMVCFANIFQTIFENVFCTL